MLERLGSASHDGLRSRALHRRMNSFCKNSAALSGRRFAHLQIIRPACVLAKASAERSIFRFQISPLCALRRFPCTASRAS